jgi:hypothetical protein
MINRLITKRCQDLDVKALSELNNGVITDDVAGGSHPDQSLTSG